MSLFYHDPYIRPYVEDLRQKVVWNEAQHPRGAHGRFGKGDSFLVAAVGVLVQPVDIEQRDPQDALTATMVSRALDLWGYQKALNIKVINLDPNSPEVKQGSPGVWASSDIWSEPGTNIIRVFPLFWTLPAESQRGIILHEVGHGLGMQHTGEESVMNDPTHWTTPTARDLTVFHALHPGDVRALYLPNVGAD